MHTLENGDFSLNEALIAHILGRIDTLVDPVFSLVDLPQVAKEEWRSLQKDRIIVEVAEPEAVQVKPGQWLSVRKTDHGIFGLDESEEFPGLVELSASDLLQYRLNLDVFFRRVCELNGFRYMRAEERHGFYSIGRKSLGTQGVATVYFSMPNVDAESVEQRLRMLEDGKTLKVIVFPRWPEVDVSEFGSDTLHIADLQPDLVIAWPMEELGSARHEAGEDYAMICKGGFWTIHYLGETIQPGNVKGLRFIAKALQRSPESLPMMEWEQDVKFTDKDQRDSSGLQAKLEPNQNLEVTDEETLNQIGKAVALLEGQIADAEEIDDTETIQDLQPKLDHLKKHKSGISYGGRPKVLGDEKMRKRVTKNLETAFKAIDRRDARIGAFIRKTVKFKSGKLTHEPDQGERWNIRIS